ncbi:hypothetical protein QWA68_016646 [Fusarium oxysporum]|nr:hypothetical protein QWA68_016646 [Fusarium oxysporum]
MRVSELLSRVAGAAAASAVYALSGQPQPIVDLDYGKYLGVRLEASRVDQYLGMRFARPPEEDLRWRAPQDPEPFQEIQAAGQFRPLCIGVAEPVAGKPEAEDCLFINVFTPSDAKPSSKLPVWLYIQGGAYHGNMDPDINGTKVVQESGHNIVMVNFNYRVGAYGFLASEEVERDGDLNVGLLDQRKAMQWVQRHISKFGGDPEHVVIHGTSAGAGSLSYHLAAYGGRNDGLFVGAIPHATYWTSSGEVREHQYKYDRFVADVGCYDIADSLACLRTANIDGIAAGNKAYHLAGAAGDLPFTLSYWMPVIDGDFVRSALYDSFTHGNFVKVPLLISSATDEGSSFAYNASTSEAFSLALQNSYPSLSMVSDIPQIISLYPLHKDMPQRAAWFPSVSAAISDINFICPANWLASRSTQYLPSKKVWHSRFNMQDPTSIARGLGTPHAQDKPAIFGPGFTAPDHLPSLNDINKPLVPVIMRYYISFVRSLDPNTYKDADAPVWKTWGPGNGQKLLLQTNATSMEPISEVNLARCNYWTFLAKKMNM